MNFFSKNPYFRKFKFPFTNIYLIKWLPNTIGPIHNHGGRDCNIFVLKGKLRENIYQQIPDNGYYMVDMKILQEYQSSYINDTIGKHSIHNLKDSNSWSLHYYK